MPAETGNRRETFDERYFDDPAYAPGLKGGDEVRGYGYYPDYFPVVQAQLAALVEITGGGRLLDAGCGKGALAEYARRELGLHTIAADASAYALRQARRRRGGCFTAAADVTALPFRDQAFDLVWCNGVLQYLPGEAAIPALRELARVTGKAAFISNIAAFHRQGEWGRHDDLTRLYLTPGQWESLARRAGLRALALPFEGESAILLLAAMSTLTALRFVERALELMRRLGALEREPPLLERFAQTCRTTNI